MLRQLFHALVPTGRRPEQYARFVQAIKKRLVFDPATQTVRVKKGPLAGMTKYGPFCESDFEFALGRYESEVTAAFHQYCRPGMTVFDIGGQAGYHTIQLSRLCGSSGHVHTFEPVAQSARCLLETLHIISLENVSVHQLAVCDREGEAEMRFSGVLDGFAYLTQGGHGQLWHEAKTSTLIRVQTTNLDRFCSKFRIPKVDLIKMDIEGAELLALSGMTRVLCTHRPVLILELWGPERIAAGSKFLRRFNYETRTLSTWRVPTQSGFTQVQNVLAVPLPGNQGALSTEKSPEGMRLWAKAFDY